MIQKLFLKIWNKKEIIAFLAVLIAMPCISSMPAHAADSGEADYVDGQILVVMDDAGLSEKKANQVQKKVEEAITDEMDAEVSGTLAEKTSEQGTVAMVEVPEELSVEKAVTQAEKLDGVAYAQPNYIYYTSESVNDPKVEDDKCYYLSQIKVPEAWDIAKTEGKVQVAVLDTGCRLDHEDLADNINLDLACDVYQTELNYKNQGVLTLTEDTDWVSLKERVSDSSGSFSGDNDGHGTHVCGLVSAEANNDKGIAGTSYNAKILPVKVFADEGGKTYTSTLAKGCQYVMYCIDQKDQKNIKIVNMSVAAMGIDDAVLRSQISKLRNDYGVLTVCAGGNLESSASSKSQKVIPSDYPECLSVVSTDEDNCLSATSMYNGNKDIAAPGVDIYSTYNSSAKSYIKMSGTSMSAPIVSGICALLWANDPDMTVGDVTEAILNTATEFGSDTDAGAAGVIDAKAALEYQEDQHTVDLSKFAEFSLDENEIVEYSGEVEKPDLYACGELLTEGEDYSLTFDTGDGKNVGEVKVTVTGMGRYTGSASLDYKISRTLTDSILTVSYVVPRYDGTEKKPLKVSVSLLPDSEIKAEEATDTNSSVNTAKAQSLESSISTVKGSSSDSGTKLVEGTDFEIVNCSNNVNATTDDSPAKFTIKGIGNYSGSIVYKFKISPRKISKATLKEDSNVYAGKDYSFELTDLDTTLTVGKDYTVEFDSTDGVIVGQVTATVTGIGNYYDTATYTLEIAPRSIEEASLKEESQIYTGDETSLSLTDFDETLTEGKDYTVDYGVSDRVNAGQVTATVTGIGNYTGSAEYSYQIVKLIEKATATSKVFVYNGKSISMGLKAYGKKLLKNTDYKISYSRSKSVGPGTATITGIGNFTGKIKISYTIKPKASKFKKKRSLKGGMILYWKKLTTQTSGYQLEISSKKSFSSYKKYTISSNKKTYKSIKKLKRKKTYYVRMRTYKNVKGKKYYSAWSKTISVKTK